MFSSDVNSPCRRRRPRGSAARARGPRSLACAASGPRRRLPSMFSRTTLLGNSPTSAPASSSAARAGEASHADDLAERDLEVDALEALAFQPRHAERHLGPVHRRLAVGRDWRAGGHRVHVAHDHVDQLLVVDVPHVDRALHAAVAQHGGPVGQLEDLVESVRDVDHARAAISCLVDQLEERVDLVGRQGGRRLVQDEDLGSPVVVVERPGDGNGAPVDRPQLRRPGS